MWPLTNKSAQIATREQLPKSHENAAHLPLLCRRILSGTQSLQSVDSFKTEICTNCRVLMIVLKTIQSPAVDSVQKNAGSKSFLQPALYRLFDFLSMVLSPQFPVFSVQDVSWCRLSTSLFVLCWCHSVIMLRSSVKRDRLELAFWLLCSMHAVIQVSPDVLCSRDGRYRPFAACTVDATVCHCPHKFSRQWHTVAFSCVHRILSQHTFADSTNSKLPGFPAGCYTASRQLPLVHCSIVVIWFAAHRNWSHLGLAVTITI